MLNKPKFLTPSLTTSSPVIDFTDNNTKFSCIVDGNEAVKAWRVTFYHLGSQTPDTPVFTTNAVVRDDPFYPIDERNRNNTFVLTLDNIKNNPAQGFSPSALTNNIEAYYWVIEMWSASDVPNSTPAANATTKSNSAVFYANATPTVSVMCNGSIITPTTPPTPTQVSTRTCEFKGTYAQAQNVPLKRYGWILTDITTNRVLVDTVKNNQIYGTKDNIILGYDGFLNDHNYTVQLYIETQNGYSIMTDPYEIDVSYSTTALSSKFKTEYLFNEPGIICDWSDVKIISGNANGDIIYRDNYPVNNNKSLEIPLQSEVVYDYGTNGELEIDEQSYVYMGFQILSDTYTKIFEAYNSVSGAPSREFVYDGNGNFVYRVTQNGNTVEMSYELTGNYETMTTQQFEQTYLPYVWYGLVLSPYLGDDGADTFFKIAEGNLGGGLYPNRGTSHEPEFERIAGVVTEVTSDSNSWILQSTSTADFEVRYLVNDQSDNDLGNYIQSGGGVSISFTLDLPESNDAEIYFTYSGVQGTAENNPFFGFEYVAASNGYRLRKLIEHQGYQYYNNVIYNGTIDIDIYIKNNKFDLYVNKTFAGSRTISETGFDFGTRWYFALISLNSSGNTTTTLSDFEYFEDGLYPSTTLYPNRGSWTNPNEWKKSQYHRAEVVVNGL